MRCLKIFAFVAIASLIHNEYVSAQVTSPTLVRPLWSYPILSTGVGNRGICAGVTATGDREIYVGGTPGPSSAFPNRYWAALAYNGNGNYDPVFASEYYPVNISRITLGDVTGNSNSEILVGLENGIVHLYDQTTKAWLSSFSTTATLSSGLADIQVEDLDGAGNSEIIVSDPTSFAVFQAGAPVWNISNAGGSLAIAQMDSDPQLEIATASGKVIDAATRIVQWDYGQSFGGLLFAGDIDGDGIAELVAFTGSAIAYDVDLQTKKWTYSDPEGLSSIAIADADADGSVEVIAGQAQSGDVICLNATGQVAGWTLPNPGYAVEGITVADTDGDGANEVIWSTRPGFDAAALYVGNPATESLEWQNTPIIGPFVGPERGDLDGDGIDEIVVSVSTAPGLMIFDALTLTLRATSQANANYGTQPSVKGLRLRDVDNDGNHEIIAATQLPGDARVHIYDCDSSNTLSINWTSPAAPFSTRFMTADAKDLDGDGTLEIVVGAEKDSSGGDRRFIYVYDYVQGALEWVSGPTSAYSSSIDIEVGDVIPGGGLEIMADTSDGLYVFDGITKAVKAFLRFSFFSDMQVKDGALYGSDSRAALLQMVWNGSGLTSTPVAQFSTSQADQGYLDAFEVLATSPLHVRLSDRGRTRVYLDGAFLTETPNYGTKHKISGAGGIAAGQYCITADYLPAPVLSVAGAARDKGTSWTRVVGDVEYRVQASTGSDFANIRDSGWIEARNYEFTALDFDQTYYFRVKARIANGTEESPWSRVVTSTTVIDPAAVNNWTLYQ